METSNKHSIPLEYLIIELKSDREKGLSSEDEAEQIRIHNLIIKVYETFPCPIVHVPVLPAEERIDFILKNL